MFSECSLSISEGSSQPHVLEKWNLSHECSTMEGVHIIWALIKSSAKETEYFYVCMLKETL